MKLKFLAIISILAVLTVACGNQDQPICCISPNPPGILSGTFQPGEHPTKGNVRIITEEGKRYLEFDKNFQTVQDPDLFVIVYRYSKVPISRIDENSYAQIGHLQKISGTQRYLIPDNVNLNTVESVAIWCHKFNITFGYAPLDFKDLRDVQRTFRNS